MRKVHQSKRDADSTPIQCDASTTSCSRCLRLGISCIGYGQKRYKFQDEGRKLAIRSHDRSRAVPTTGNDTLKPVHNAQVSANVRVAHVPSNGLTQLTLAFVDKIDPSIDISVQLVGNFGGFLSEIPRRLGTNASLDAASDLLQTSYAHYRAGHRNSSTAEALIKHSRALRALNDCLNDPVMARSSETLCSIMVLLICQVG